LAIELAAASVNLLDPQQILATLDGRLDVVDRPAGHGAGRHRTVEASMDWSYELLSEAEQQTLRSLAVFAGGFPLDGAARVTGTAHVEPVLASLIDKSLVVAEAAPDGRRYGLLETVREYAGQRLTDAGEVEAARDRHLGWIERLARDAEPQLCGAEQEIWLD